MLEPNTIQMKGFKNVTRDGQATGFQLRVRCPYYRGIWASLLEQVEVVVDGETFLSERIRLGLGGRSFSTTELAELAELRWPFEEAAILTVDKPGGLEPGLHHVQLSVTWRWSYIPVEFQPTTNISERKLVLVH
jgi:hypothetical protein